MSLESAIQENTAALNALLAALLAGAKVQADQGTTTPTDLAKSKTEDVKPKAESKPKAETKPKAEPKPEPEVPTGPTMDEIAAACVDLIKKDRPALIALLAEFKVKKASELKPEQFAEFKERLDAELAAEAGEDLV